MLNITFSSNAETSLLLHDWNVGVKLYPINKPLLISIKKNFFVSPISLIKKYVPVSYIDDTICIVEEENKVIFGLFLSPF